MKIPVIIATILVVQVSASFMDVFQGAVLSVQNSFGKLFSDVVTDVKDTVDCTILAVEHVLSLSEDATARYYEKCGSDKNGTHNDGQIKNNYPVLEISIANNEDYLKKELPEEIDARINETLSKFFNGYNPHNKLEDVQKELAKETERLANVSDLVREELDKLSNEIHIDFSNIERKGFKPSVDSILEELKVLEAIEQNIKNSSEANEIHRLIDSVLNKLHEIEFSEASQNEKVDGILRDLEKSSNRSYKDMRQQLEDWKTEEARHLNVIENKMDEHEKLPEHLEYVKFNNTFATTEQPKIAEVNAFLQNTTTLNVLTFHPTDIPISSATEDLELDSEKKIKLSATLTPLDDGTKSSRSEYPPSKETTPISLATVLIPLFNDEKLIPSENNFVTKTIPSSLKKTSMDFLASTPTTITITDSKFLNSQFSSTPKIATQKSSNVTSPVQINDASDVITPVPISTSSYVNEANVDATEMLNSQTIKERLGFDGVSKKTTIPLTIIKSTFATTNLPVRTQEPTIEVSERGPEFEMNRHVNSVEPTFSVSVTSSEPDESLLNNRLERSTAIASDASVMIPLHILFPETSSEFSVSSVVTTPMHTLSHLISIPVPTGTSLATAPKSTKSFPTTLGPSKSTLLQIDKTTIAAISMTEPNENLVQMQSEPTASFAVTSHEGVTTRVSPTRPESTINLKLVDLPPTTNPASPEPSARASEPPTSSATTPEYTASLQMIVPECTTNPTTISETIPPVVVSESTSNPTVLPETAASLRVTVLEPVTTVATALEPTTTHQVIDLESSTNRTVTPEPTTTATDYTTSSGTTAELSRSFPVTTSEIIISPTTLSEMAVGLPVTATELNTSPETTPQQATRPPVLDLDSESSVTSSEPPTELPVTVIDFSTSSAKTPKRSTSVLVTFSEPTTSTEMTLLPITSPSVMISDPTTNIISEYITSPSPIYSEPSSSRLESPSKFIPIPAITPEPSTSVTVTTTFTNSPMMALDISSPSSSPSTTTRETTTTGLLLTTLKSTTSHHLDNMSSTVLSLPTRRPKIPTPSLLAFLDFIDRKEGITKPVMSTTEMPLTQMPNAGGSKFNVPMLHTKTNTHPVNDQLNAFFSHLSKDKSPPPRNDSTVSSISINKNVPPKMLSPPLRHLPPHRPYNKPLHTGARFPQNLNRPMGLTTNRPVTTPKRNNYEDADYKSFFHLPSKNTEAHNSALKDAKKLIEDSQRAHRVINKILNKKKKGISAFNLPKSLKIGK